MKKHLRNLICITVSSALWTNVHALESSATDIVKDNVFFDVSAGAWLVNWDQQSTAKNQFGNDSISTDYGIQSAPASSLRAQLGFSDYLSAKFEYAKVNESSGKDLSNLSGALGLFIHDFTFYSHLNQGRFNGSLSGVKTSDGSEDFGSGTFTTKLNVSDWLIFYKNVGFGYRNYRYELPQDLYLVSSSNPSNVIVSGFEEIKYSGDFMMLGIDSSLRQQKEGWNYSLYGGMGKLSPSGSFLDSLNADSTINSANSGKSVMSKGDASFIEASLAYQWLYKSGFMNWGVNAGYKYSQISATFDNKANYSLVTDFKTTLDGPFVEVKGSF